MKHLLQFSLVFFFHSVGNTQQIRAIFTQSVDNTVSSITDASQSAHLEDTICKIINQSDFSLDICVWDNGSVQIVSALNAAYMRGVVVRYITSSNSLNLALSSLSPAINVLERNAGLTTNVMHNKFIIADNKLVFMGSMNFGMGSMEDDYNNILIIDDETLAANYTLEFEEMWGGTGGIPIGSNSKFGPDKTDNTVHNFTIQSELIESYFSPSDNTTQQLINAINSADYSLDIALFTFLNNDLGDAVVAAKNNGVQVRCIIENSNYFGSEYTKLVNAGIDVISHASIPTDFHHKYAIIDALVPSSDPRVITGSHNWTASAEEEYDENTLILHSLILAQQYKEEFEKRFVDLGGSSILTEQTKRFQLYPNPSNGSITIINPSKDIEEVEIWSTTGTLISKFRIQDIKTIQNLGLPPGIYFLTAASKQFETIKITVF